MGKCIQKVANVKYKQNENVYDVKIMLGSNRIFLLEDSLPRNVVPKVGDRILWDFEVEYLLVTGVEHLFFPFDRRLCNYVLNLSLP